MSIFSPGAPPSTIRAYVEDMLHELADLADGLHEPRLACAIRGAGAIAAETNARAWLALRREDDLQNRR
jgi:hypothetical protein